MIGGDPLTDVRSAMDYGCEVVLPTVYRSGLDNSGVRVKLGFVKKN